MEVGAGVEQDAHDVVVALGDRPHERGLTAPRFRRVHGGASRDEVGDDVRVARPGGGHEHGFAFCGGGIGIGAALEERLDDRDAAARGREHQGRDAVTVRGGHVRARADDHRDRRRVVRVDGPVERRRAVGL